MLGGMCATKPMAMRWMIGVGEGEWSFFVEGEELVQTGGGVMRESVDDVVAVVQEMKMKRRPCVVLLLWFVGLASRLIWAEGPLYKQKMTTTALPDALIVSGGVNMRLLWLSDRVLCHDTEPRSVRR